MNERFNTSELLFYFSMFHNISYFSITYDFTFTESLGSEYSETHILDLELTWEESEPRTPLVCILSTGSDPTNQIIALAKLKNIRKFKRSKFSWRF